MKKFIAAFDGLSFSESTKDYAILLTKQASAHLVGVFLDDFTRRSYSVADIVKYEGEEFDKRMSTLDEHDKEVRDESIDKFESACRDEGINYSIHRNRNIALHELLHESIYADLLIINSKETITRYEEQPPSRFIRELLSEVQCPVLLVPDNYRNYEKVILLYDGEPSSVHAVRSFSYLFESLKDLDTEVVTVKSMEDSLHLPDNRLMKEFMKRHYPNAQYVILKGRFEDEILQYLHREKKNAIVVLGAYRRNKVSRLFRPSMADHLMQHLKMPLFVAHNKS
ncbi:MAG TPA: universal stress protein [Chitinophagaceae bacterium]